MLRYHLVFCPRLALRWPYAGPALALGRPYRDPPAITSIDCHLVRGCALIAYDTILTCNLVTIALFGNRLPATVFHSHCLHLTVVHAHLHLTLLLPLPLPSLACVPLLCPCAMRWVCVCFLVFSSHYYLPAFVTTLSGVVCVESARIPRGICEDLIAHDAALRCTTLLRTVVHAHLYLTLLLPASPFARMRAVTLHLLVRCDRWVFTSSCFLHYFHLPFSRFRVLLPAPFSAARCAGGQCVLSFCGVEYEVLWFFRSSPSLLRRGVLCRGILFHPRSSCFTHALSHFASPTVFAV